MKEALNVLYQSPAGQQRLSEVVTNQHLGGTIDDYDCNLLADERFEDIQILFEDRTRHRMVTLDNE